MKKQATNSNLAFHFMIGFIVYLIIGEIASSVVDVYFDNNAYRLILKYGENMVYIVYIFITALIVHFIATYLSARSLYKHFEIDNGSKKEFVVFVSIFFIIVALIIGIINSERFIMVFIINLLVLTFMLGYVYLKIISYNVTYKKNPTKVTEQVIITNEPETIVPVATESNDEINILSESKSNTRFNPLTGMVEEIPEKMINPTTEQSDNLNLSNQSSEQTNLFEQTSEQTNLFDQQVDQQEQNINYMDIFTNPTKVNNNDEQK